MTRTSFQKTKKNYQPESGPVARFGKPGAKLCVLLTAFLFSLPIFMSCSDSGSGSSGTTTTTTSTAELTTYEMPAEISAVPVDTDASDPSAALNRSLSSSLLALSRAATDAGTDYSVAETRKYVEEHALEQFTMLENVLNALSQTNYTDEIGNGPYKAMVAFQDEENGTNKKSLEAWVCQSDAMTDADGNSYLRARAWIEEQDDDGEDELVKAEFKIYAAPTKNDDGSYADYGRWDLNVKFGEDGTEDFFAASCDVNDNGITVLKIHEMFMESGPGSETELPAEMMAILYRSGTEGYGRVQYPDWEELWGPNADPDLTELTPIQAAYAYNENYLAVKDGDGDTVFKDRTDIVEMTHRYGVFNAATGEDVMGSKSFGFPIYWTTDGGSTKRAYYGAWQGRHQLWTQDGRTVAEGTEVTREDFDPNATPETYTVGETFNGVLSKRTYVDASLDDIKGIAVELWVDNSYNLTYNAGNQTWYHCPQMNWEAFPPECAVTPIDFDTEIGFASLVVGADDNKKNVNIGGYDQVADANKAYVYELASADNGNQAGFYEATETQGEHGPEITVNDPRQLIDTSKVTQLWIWVGGSIYVEYTGAGNTGWVEKELINFDQRTWTPEFGSTDKDFILPENRELYINMQGANYVVRKETGQDPTCRLELQTAVNPGNATDVVPDGTVFSDPWNDAGSTYEFITDPTDADYLMLVYKTIGDNDKDQNGDPKEGVEVGGIVGNVWGVETTFPGDSEPTAFNWEYNADGGWGSVSYLKNPDNSYKLLDDPMRFDSFTAQNGAGDTKTLSLQFDGWMMGLPEMYQDLEKNDWTMSEDIAGKIINLPAGTPLTEATTGTEYLLKPLEISQFLSLTSATSGLPDIALGQSVDLSTVPDFVEHGMGDMPTDVDLLYSEGLPVE